MNERNFYIKTYGWEILIAECDGSGLVNIKFSASKNLTINFSSRAKDAAFRVRACLKRYRPESLTEDEIIYAAYSSFS